MTKTEIIEWPRQAAVLPSQAPEAAPARSWDDLDQVLHAMQGRATYGASPLAVGLAFADFAAHAANAPFRSLGVGVDALRGVGEFWASALSGEWTAPEPSDHRFSDPLWLSPPFALWREAFLRLEDWADAATRDMPGVTPQNERLVNFTVRQWLDAAAPSNAPWLNPEVIARTAETRGLNFLQGLDNLAGDLASLSGRPRPDGHAVGVNLAVTAGEVVFRNELFELIQYAPQTGRVRPEPVLITPAWIMKYYILDLSPQNSLIRYLVGQGFTVFCMSWRNPGPELSEVSFDDYRRDGLMAALDVVAAIRPGVKVHACGYCLGGTLLAIAASAMARDGDARLASITLLCAQLDFADAGELQLFTTEDQVAFLDDVMDAQGYLDGRQMGGAFQLLRSRDLIWSRLVKTYWMGERDQPSDLMVWNEDATRMPHRMHVEYLRALYLNNDLAEGRFKVAGRVVTPEDIRAPLFVVSTETDHVAPWRSVYKIHLMNPGEVTFVLTTGGHNAGIVSEPGHPHRSFRIRTRAPGERYLGPNEWRRDADERPGSWWPAWAAWLADRSGPQVAPPPAPGGRERSHPVLEPAPGRYVFQR